MKKSFVLNWILFIILCLLNTEKYILVFFSRVDAYHNRSTELDEADLALRGDLTDYEKHLVESQDLVEIRGKVSI